MCVFGWFGVGLALYILQERDLVMYQKGRAFINLLDYDDTSQVHPIASIIVYTTQERGCVLALASARCRRIKGTMGWCCSRASRASSEVEACLLLPVFLRVWRGYVWVVNGWCACSCLIFLGGVDCGGWVVVDDTVYTTQRALLLSLHRGVKRQKTGV